MAAAEAKAEAFFIRRRLEKQSGRYLTVGKMEENGKGQENLLVLMTLKGIEIASCRLPRR